MARRPQQVTKMIMDGRLESVEVNAQHATSVLEAVKQHVQTAELLATTDDQAMAFTAAYDGARKALVAVLAVEGLRVRPVGGAHRNTGVAVDAIINDPAMAEFEWMRQVRNATEYPDDSRLSATQSDVIEAIDAASAIVTACSAYVDQALED